MKTKKPKRKKEVYWTEEKISWFIALTISLGYSFSIILSFISYFIFKNIIFSLTFIITFIVFMNLAILYELYKLKIKDKKEE